MVFRVAVFFLTLAASCHCGLLGAGYGAGSCAAAPFRSLAVDHAQGCPAYAECCSEYGYCHSRESWLEGNFRDCNGESNGTPLAREAIEAEARAAAQGDSAAQSILAAAGVATPAGGYALGLGAGASGLGAAGFGAGVSGAGFGAAGVSGAGF